jgi:hypothetical protein
LGGEQLFNRLGQLFLHDLPYRPQLSLNVALFDCGAAGLINCGLSETNSASFKFNQCSNLYFISKSSPELKKQQGKEPNTPALRLRRPNKPSYE